MSYPINYPTPQNANVQVFNVDGSNGWTRQKWIKPQGASFVWFTLIGAGGNGDSTTGGASGAVTNFMCPAFLIPDSLDICVAAGGSGGQTYITYSARGHGLSPSLILFANSASGVSVGSAMTANYFTAMGFFQSVAGQSGNSGSAISASTTTFLSGGGDDTNTQNSNYGYSNGSTGNRNGFFQMQPIIVGAGGMGAGNGGIGCGGGVFSGKGGNGLAVIITW